MSTEQMLSSVRTLLDDGEEVTYSNIRSAFCLQGVCEPHATHKAHLVVNSLILEG
jgi:hypothetical protein